jgi:hypothetical protein
MGYAVEDVNTINALLLGSLEGVLSKLDLTLTDHALSDFIFAILAAQSGEEGAQPQAIREEYVTMAESGGSSLEPEALKKLASDVALFLKKPGGTFTLALHPAKPVPLQQAEVAFLMDPESFGLSSAVTVKD